MASVFKAKGAKKFTIIYTDEHGKRRKKRGYSDKGETMKLARKLEDRVDKIHDGLLDPRDEQYQKHESDPLTVHVEAFGGALEAKNVTEKHVTTSVSRLRKVFELAKV